MKAARPQSTLFVAKACVNLSVETGFQRKWIFRENSVESEIRAVLAEYREEFPISKDQCREDQTRLRAGA